MGRIGSAVAALVVAATLASAGAADGQPKGTTLRLYDAKGLIKTQVTLSDVVRGSAHARKTSLGIGRALYFRLTRRGVKKCNELTRLLARRGARVGFWQFAAFSVNGHVYARPSIDYHAFPNGFDCSTGIEIDNLTAQRASSLARLIRSSP